MSIQDEMLKKLGHSSKNGQSVAELSTDEISIEEIFTAPFDDSERSRDYVHFDTDIEPPKEPPNSFKQIKIKKACHLPVANHQDLNTELEIKEVIYFFNKYPFVNLSNFRIAERLFTHFLRAPETALEKLALLREEIDKNTNSSSKFGKLVMDWKVTEGSYRLSFERTKLLGCKQYIAIYPRTLSPLMLVYTKHNWKNKKSELIRSRGNLNYHQTNDLDSIHFDAKVWTAFNYSGIQNKHYLKTLDCLERNQKTLAKFITEVNQKSLLNLFEDDLLNNVSIKTDNGDTCFLSFRTNTNQRVDAKLTSFASSITVIS